MYKLFLIDKSELKKGESEEAEEHGFTPDVAHRTALDHLEKKDPHYYSKLADLGLEEEGEEKLEEYKTGFGGGKMGDSKYAQGIKSTKTFPFTKENTGGRLKRLKKYKGKFPFTVVGGSNIGEDKKK